VAVRDVDQEALQEQRVVLLVPHSDGLVVHPDDPSVGGGQAVLHPEALAGRVRAFDFGDHPLVIVGVKALREEAGLEPVGHGEAEHRFDARAHVLGGQRHADRVDVRGERDLLDECPVLRLGLTQALFPISALGDVADRDGEQHWAGNVDAGDRNLRRERTAVGAQRGDLKP
jgi:hypothetical protein